MQEKPLPETRPDWWPTHEAWPPKSWRSMRRRFMWRAAIVMVVLVVLVSSACTLAFWVTALSVGVLDPPRGWRIDDEPRITPREIAPPPALPTTPNPPGRFATRPRFFFLGPLVWIVFIAGLILLIRRAFRSVISPLGDVMQAAQRVAAGDYETRVKPRGNRDVRALALSFNAMATRLQDNETQRRNLMADVTHELRTPLSVIQGNLEGMIDGVYARDETHLQTALEETHVMARLIEDLRMLSVAASGTLKLQKERVDLFELASDVIDAFGSAARDARVQLRFSTVENPVCEVLLDPVRIREVLSNLISNALRHTPQEGEISVVLSCDAHTAHIEVTDTGSGIKPEDLPHIFERFYKTSDSRGSGLGLAIARSLVRAHGGEISAKSILGAGTTLSFTLPIVP